MCPSLSWPPFGTPGRRRMREAAPAFSGPVGFSSSATQAQGLWSSGIPRHERPRGLRPPKDAGQLEGGGHRGLRLGLGVARPSLGPSGGAQGRRRRLLQVGYAIGGQVGGAAGAPPNLLFYGLGLRTGLVRGLWEWARALGWRALPHTYYSTLSSPKHTYLLTSVHIYCLTYIYAYRHAYVHTYMFACMHECIPTYIPTYLHTYISTYTHT